MSIYLNGVLSVTKQDDGEEAYEIKVHKIGVSVSQTFYSM